VIHLKYALSRWPTHHIGLTPPATHPRALAAAAELVSRLATAAGCIGNADGSQVSIVGKGAWRSDAINRGGEVEEVRPCTLLWHPCKHRLTIPAS
jgi:hypothetical protein